MARYLIGGLLAAVVATGCVSTRAPVLAGPEETARVGDALARAWAKLGDAGKRGDVEGIVDSYTEDALLMEPGHDDIRGRDGLRAVFGEGLKTWAISEFEVSPRELTVIGDRAFQLVDYREAGHPKDQPPGPAAPVRAFVEWRRDAAGTWRIHRLLNNNPKMDSSPASR